MAYDTPVRRGAARQVSRAGRHVRTGNRVPHNQRDMGDMGDMDRVRRSDNDSHSQLDNDMVRRPHSHRGNAHRHHLDRTGRSGVIVLAGYSLDNICVGHSTGAGRGDSSAAEPWQRCPAGEPGWCTGSRTRHRTDGVDADRHRDHRRVDLVQRSDSHRARRRHTDGNATDPRSPASHNSHNIHINHVRRCDHIYIIQPRKSGHIRGVNHTRIRQLRTSPTRHDGDHTVTSARRSAERRDDDGSLHHTGGSWAALCESGPPGARRRADPCQAGVLRRRPRRPQPVRHQAGDGSPPRHTRCPRRVPEVAHRGAERDGAGHPSVDHERSGSGEGAPPRPCVPLRSAPAVERHAVGLVRHSFRDLDPGRDPRRRSIRLTAAARLIPA